MELSRSLVKLAGLVAFCFAGHAFVNGRFTSMAKPAKTGHDVGTTNVPKPSDAAEWLWSTTGHALSVGAALGMVFALTQASARAEDTLSWDLESQVTVALKDKGQEKVTVAPPIGIDKEAKKKQLEADQKALDKFTKGGKVRDSEDKLAEYKKDLENDLASTERYIRAGAGVRSVKRKSLQKEKTDAPLFTGLDGLPSISLPEISLPSISLPGGGSVTPSFAAPGEDAAVGILSGAAVSLGLPAVVVAGAVNRRIQEKQREEVERKARERADPTGAILTTVAGLGAAVVFGNALLASIPQAKVVEKAPIVTTAKPAADDSAAKKAAADTAAADKAAADKAAADKAAADKAAADKAAADKAAADKAAADKAAADKAAADKAAADKAAADKAAADKAAADKAAADKAAADKAAADKAAEAAAAARAAAEKAAADRAAAAAKVEAAPAPETTQGKIAAKGGYFAYMKSKQ
ncbi:unnamed protein product [Durusdinium trenchii]|uniref:TolA protein n=1 Tax=Durusdinium trenchii TaxID=1381693 RepID=A0ABP0SYM8_9DINO